MSFASSSFDGTVQELPLIETNHHREFRAVTVKHRKLGGKRGKAVRVFSKLFVTASLFYDAVSNDDDDSYSMLSEPSTISSAVNSWVSHWGVQVGDYLWELHTDSKHAKTLSMQRLTREQIWKADVGEIVIGYTNMTDEEIHIEALGAFSDMKCRHGGKYDEFENNCQDFVSLHVLRMRTAALFWYSEGVAVNSIAFIFRSVNDAVDGSAAAGYPHDTSPLSSSSFSTFSLAHELAMIMDLPDRTGFGAPVAASQQPMPSAGVRWTLVFVWQVPVMMMSYSIVGFLVGLIVYVTAPLYNEEVVFDGASKSAIMFLGSPPAPVFKFISPPSLSPPLLSTPTVPSDSASPLVNPFVFGAAPEFFSATKLLELFSKLYSNWKDAPDDTRKFVLELQSLRVILSEVDRNANSNPEFARAFHGRHSALLSELDPLHNTDTAALIGACETELRVLLEKLKKREGGHQFGWERIKAVLDTRTYLEVKKGREEQMQNHRAYIHGFNSLGRRVDNAEAQREREEVLNWLAPSDYSQHHADILRRRQPGTGQWFLDSPQFQKWLSNMPQILFCPGIPGAGKTFIVAAVIDYLQRRFHGNPRIGVAFLYCNFRRKHEQQAEDLIANLLKQLAGGIFPLPQPVTALHRSNSRPSLEKLLGALSDVAALYEDGVFVVVDALDECQLSEMNRSRFLSGLLKFQSASGSRANLLATSRPRIPDIVTHFEGHPTLDISAHTGDIEEYLRGHMDQLGGCVVKRSDLQQEIIDCIVNAADGMFLLAHLFLQSLTDKLTITAIRKALAQLRRQRSASAGEQRLALLSLAYDSAMERINGQMDGHRALAHHVLSWIICAERPLVTSEVQHAWAVGDSKDALDQDNLPGVEDMISVCCGLVTIDAESGVIRLVHYTTQEYFERTLDRWFPGAHQTIAETPMNESLLNQLSTDVVAFHLISVFGLSGVLRRLLARAASADPDQKDSLGVTPLMEAAGRGHADFVCFLLSSGKVNPDSTSQDGASALLYGAVSGSAEVVSALLATGHVDINRRGPVGNTPLILAAADGYAAVVQLLLANENIDVNVVNDDGETALLCAARGGHNAVVQLLLANENIDVNVVDDDRETALLYAARGGHVAMVQSLLAKENIDVNVFNTYDDTALISAIPQMYTAVVELLVAHKDIELNRNPGRRTSKSPLCTAAERGFLEGVQILLKTGRVDVNETDPTRISPTLAAAGRAHLEVVKALLATGQVDVNAQDKQGYTILHPLA
ncbi:hypothetical protein VTJ49DRAFT_6085 [Mycothermus thermophilus]|uniref:Uncharacterized protein n=1 Tax=Humicola insolens TaxID=85995 RepID=A0ABR3V2D8_HUMIN